MARGYKGFVSSHLVAAAAASQQMFLLLDEDGALKEPSPSWCSFTGQSPEEAAGHGWRHALHAEDAGSLDSFFTGAQTERLAHCRLRRPNGRYVGMECRCVPGNKGEWVASLRERWTDESVRQSEERLRLAT